MKYLIWLLIVIFPIISFNQKELKNIHLKRSLKQDGEQYQFNVLERDKKGVKNHNKNKFYYWYKSQQVISTQGASSGDLLHGSFEAFHDNKQLSKKGFFKKGLKYDEWLYWRKDGTLLKSEEWKSGNLKKETQYDQQGVSFQTTKYGTIKIKRENADSTIIENKWLKSKKVYIKDSIGNPVKIENYKNGKLHGTSTYYGDGEISKIRYKKGEVVTKEKDIEEVEKRKWWQIFSKKEKDQTEKSKETKQKNKTEKKQVEGTKGKNQNSEKPKDKQTKDSQPKEKKQDNKKKEIN